MRSPKHGSAAWIIHSEIGSASFRLHYMMSLPPEEDMPTLHCAPILLPTIMSRAISPLSNARPENAFACSFPALKLRSDL